MTIRDTQGTLSLLSANSLYVVYNDFSLSMYFNKPVTGTCEITDLSNRILLGYYMQLSITGHNNIYRSNSQNGNTWNTLQGWIKWMMAALHH